MNNTDLVLKKDLLFDKIGILDAVVESRAISFKLERTEKIDLDVLKDQSYFIENKDEAGVIRFKLNEYKTKYNDSILTKNGTFYLNNLDSEVTLTFKKIPPFLEEIIDFIQDLEEDLRGDAKEYPDIYQEINEKTKANLAELQEKIEKLDNFQEKIRNEANDLNYILSFFDKKQQEDQDEENGKGEEENLQEEIIAASEEIIKEDYFKKYMIFKENLIKLKDIYQYLENLNKNILIIITNIKIIIEFFNQLKDILNVYYTKLSSNHDSDLIREILGYLTALNDKLKHSNKVIKEFKASLE